MASNKTVIKSLITFIVAATVCWTAFALFIGSLGQKGPLEEPVSVIIPKGASVGAIAKQLQDAGVINSPLKFRIGVRATFADRTLQAGEYSFDPGISIREAITKISGGDVLHRTVTLPEGLTVAEVTQRLMTTDGLFGPPLAFDEGALLPDTYAFRYGDKVTEMMRRMAVAMTDTVNAAWELRAPDLPLENPHDLLVLASIVEKETARDEERDIVASVYVNRLKKGMKLQADPTVIYGASGYTGDITNAHLKEDHAYNTYVHKGLPPGPICNPGRASIQAAAQPAQTEYLFFVADGNGGHLFAKTYEEHRKNVQDFLRKQKELLKNAEK
ncbi:MAG: endolytic transglycosylase MltG [Proteobacteria bacterium]|nr:endolytic transglycosylase MltG [Pseudomonadota bacterium]